MEQVGDDHRHERGVVHDERDHERHQEQEADLAVATSELQAQLQLRAQRLVGSVRAGQRAHERPGDDHREEARRVEVEGPLQPPRADHQCRERRAEDPGQVVDDAHRRDRFRKLVLRDDLADDRAHRRLGECGRDAAERTRARAGAGWSAHRSRRGPRARSTTGPRARCPSPTIRRRGIRSAIAPPTGDSTRNGRNCATRLSDNRERPPAQLPDRPRRARRTGPTCRAATRRCPTCTSAKSRWRRTRIERGRRDRMATMWRSCWPDDDGRRQMGALAMWYDTCSDRGERRWLRVDWSDGGCS